MILQLKIILIKKNVGEILLIYFGKKLSCHYTTFQIFGSLVRVFYSKEVRIIFKKIYNEDNFQVNE